MESIQTTIKHLEQKKEHIERMLEKGSSVLVLQLGSHSLKLGFANDRNPLLVRALLARRRTQPCPQPAPAAVPREQREELRSRVRESGNIKI
jgi:hypothetical protein